MVAQVPMVELVEVDHDELLVGARSLARFTGLSLNWCQRHGHCVPSFVESVDRGQPTWRSAAVAEWLELT